MISSKAIGEDPKEFEALLQRLWDHYQPADIAEELQVETIAVCLWRERQALRSELAEVGYAREERTERKRTLRQLTDELHGPGKALQFLRAAESGVSEDGELSREMASALSRVFRWEELNKATLERIRAGEEKDPETCPVAGAFLRSSEKMIEELERFRDERQESEESAIVERYSIPEKDHRPLPGPERPPAAAHPQLERAQRQGDYVAALLKGVGRRAAVSRKRSSTQLQMRIVKKLRNKANKLFVFSTPHCGFATTAAGVLSRTG